MGNTIFADDENISLVTHSDEDFEGYLNNMMSKIH